LTDQEWLAQRFNDHRSHLRAVAYRMLGSVTEADDAVQETWLRLSRADSSQVENLRAWLTTVVSRVSLNMLRSRRSRREESLDVLPDPVARAEAEGEGDPEREAVLADSVGLALLVVLDTLSPAERLAFVLHDMFGVPFGEIAPIVGRSPTATRQLASRARRRVRSEAPAADGDLRGQRAVIDAFVKAAREGDFDALLALLDPDVVVRADRDAAPPYAPRTVRGARAVAQVAESFASLAPSARRALVNGAAGVVVAPQGRPFAVLGFRIRNGKIVEMNVWTDPERLKRIDLSALDD
jgi:RNA polymerase sigma-70 factor, ECF subfamily